MSAQTSNELDSVNQKIDEYINVQMRRNFIPGLSLAVVKEGKIVKIKGYGLSNIETNTAGCCFNPCCIGFFERTVFEKPIVSGR